MCSASGLASFTRFLAVLLFGLSGLASATPVTVADPFHMRQNAGENLGNFPVGDRLFFGAFSVVPNGAGGTTGAAVQAPQTVLLFSRSFDIADSQFIASIPYNPARTGSWALTFANGTDSAGAATPTVGGVPLMPLAIGITATGPVLTPTISWTIPAIPAGLTLEGETIVVFDLDDLVTLDNGSGTTLQQPNAIFVSFLTPSSTSFTLPAGVLDLGGRYLFQVQLADFRAPPREISVGPILAATVSRSNAYLTYVIPEPGSILLSLAGLAAMALLRRR